MRTLALEEKKKHLFTGPQWGRLEKRKGGMFFPGTPSATPQSVGQNTSAFQRETKASSQPSLTESHFKSSQTPLSCTGPLSLRPYQYNNCDVPIKRLRQGPDIVQGLRSDASSVAQALLSYWGRQMKGEVSHTAAASRFIQLGSHLHVVKTSKSLSGRVESRRKGHRGVGRWNPKALFNIKLAFRRTSSTVMDMNNAWHWRRRRGGGF